jgi:formate dehydrogenase iron-sulfur subunit
MSEPEAAIPIKATLIDTTKCIGCRACQVACKQWNDREGEQTELQDYLGFQNPATLSSNTYTLITFDEVPNEKAPGGLQYISTMRRCLHCLEPACASACPTTALKRQPDGPVTYDASKCIGCRYCIWACPWGVPTAEWDSHAPKIQKCTHCADRSDQPLPLARNGQALTQQESKVFSDNIRTPACVKACPADALRFGTRDNMLQEARNRISNHPDKYVDHIYGEKEAGGTSVMYLSSVPFEKLGFPALGMKPYPSLSKIALHAVPPAVIALGAVLGGTYSLFKRRAFAAAERFAPPHPDDDHNHHVEFEPIREKLLTPFNWILLAFMAFGVISLIARFALGLGGSTHLSDTYAWGLWIVFDLVWIAVAAGAFATAGLIYVFQRKDLYSMGRSAVLMGLLSYSFVTVTLIADLGLPWHFYQLGLQAPEHSAMFEVSWCVGLYVTVLLLEFLPVPFERWGLQGAMESWRRWSGFYVAFAVTLFVYLLSRQLVYAALAAIVFSLLAWIFPKDKKAEPIMLAIAAVTLSTMHQSSLGSLFLLMPDKLSPQWWSPVMPISYFLSSIAAGTALVILVEFWIAKGWNRQLRVAQLSAMGQITFWALLVYLVFHLGEMAVRHQFADAFSGRLGALFVAEIVLGGILPLALLARASQRARPAVLFVGALLTMLGVVFNRVNVVLLAMHLKGPMPQVAPATYSPTVFEWGVSVGLIAATIFLFGLGARLMPILPKQEIEQRS